MKFCPECGFELDNDNFKFCPECGYKFESNNNINSKQNENSEPKGFIDGVIKGIRDQIPDEYIDKIKDNEVIDDAITHAKIMWHGPQTEKEKAYKEKQQQKKEQKDPIKYKINEVTGKHYIDSPYFTKRKELFYATEDYIYYKDILKWEVKNCNLEYDDIEARLDELLKINAAKEIFELRNEKSTCSFKTREDLEQYLKSKNKSYSIPIDDEETEMNSNDGLKTSPEKENFTQQKTVEPNYTDFELSDLQESLIKSLPVINTPSTYEENIIKKYAEFNSEERKELLKDCWTVTKLANEHNINRQQVQNEILTDEFLDKDLIGVFKVNPDNIRSLKILYRKPLSEKEQSQETVSKTSNEELIKSEKETVSKTSNEELVKPEKEIVSKTSNEELVKPEKETPLTNENVVKEVKVPEEPVKKHVEEKTESSQEESSNASTKVIQDNKGNDNKNQKRSLFGGNSSDKKEFNKQLKFYVGGIAESDYFRNKKEEFNKGEILDINQYFVKGILKKEFKNGKLSVDGIENRLDELFGLDVKSMYELSEKKVDTSSIKTQDDLSDYLLKEYGEKRAEESRKNADKNYRINSLFEKYGVDLEGAYFFKCSIEERRSSTFYNTDRRNLDTAYVALFDDYIGIIKESVFLKSDMGMRKVFFKTVSGIDYDTSGKLGMSNSLFIRMHSGEPVQLKFISEKDVAEVQAKFEKYMAQKDTPNTVQINQETSNADELLKYAELYKQGILTEEEFEAKKKELL